MIEVAQAKLSHLHDRVAALEKDLQANTAATQRVEANTSELVEVFRSLQGAFKVIAGIASILKPIGYIAAACAAVWGLVLSVKNGAGITPK